MAELEFCDVNLTLGRPRIPKYAVATDPAVMAKELATVGIRGGLVRHVVTLECHPREGNPLLVKALAEQSAYRPVWGVVPHWTGEFGEPAAVAKEMSQCGAAAAIMYPVRNGFGLRPSVAGPLLEMLEERRFPLILPFDQAALPVVEETATRYPGLPIIISEAGYTIARELYAMFSSRENVYFETSGYMLHRGIEHYCAKFGPDRMLFGSRYPLYNPGCAVAGLLYADIADSAKARIASGNIKRILSEVRG